jgi:hypothetical protein
MYVVEVRFNKKASDFVVQRIGPLLLTESPEKALKIARKTFNSNYSNWLKSIVVFKQIREKIYELENSTYGSSTYVYLANHRKDGWVEKFYGEFEKYKDNEKTK